MTASDFVTTYVPGSASAIYDVATGGEVDVNKRNHEDDLRCATWAFFEEKELRGPTRNYIRRYDEYFRTFESTSVQRVNKRVPLLTYLYVYVYPITTHNRHNPYMSAVQTTFCEAFSNFRAYSSYGSTSRRIYVQLCSSCLEKIISQKMSVSF
jgi:hypothetical protein